MPGSIKVSGAQRTVAAPYVKISGTWRPAAVAYVKVSGAWRQWYASSISDDFNRTDSSSLGTAPSSVSAWSDTRGTWGIVSNKAQTSTSASTYPISVVPNAVSVSDYELRIDIPSGAGAGVALWVTDSNNWYSVTTNTIVTTSYSCPSGGSLSGTTCYVSATCPGGCSSTYYGQPTGGGSYSYSGNVTVTYTLVGNQCGTQCGNLGYSCINGSCYAPSYTTDCSQLISYSGSSCTGTVPASCSSGSYYSSDPCGGGSAGCYSYSTYPPYDCSTSYSATSSTSTTYAVQVTKMLAGSASVIHSFATLYEPRSLKVTTSNGLISIIAYSGLGLTGTQTSSTHTATSPVTTRYAGIALAPSSSSQTNAVDNFYLK